MPGHRALRRGEELLRGRELPGRRGRGPGTPPASGARAEAATFTGTRSASSGRRPRWSPRCRERAIGGGLGLAVSADFRVTCPEGRFSANFTRLGFHPGFGLTVTLPELVGRQRAALMFYTGRRIKGDEALEWGLADALAPLDRVRDAACEIAREIAASAPLAVVATRATVRGDLAERVARATDSRAGGADPAPRNEGLAGRGEGDVRAPPTELRRSVRAAHGRRGRGTAAVRRSGRGRERERERREARFRLPRPGSAGRQGRTP